MLDSHQGSNLEYVPVDVMLLTDSTHITPFVCYRCVGLQMSRSANDRDLLKT